MIIDGNILKAEDGFMLTNGETYGSVVHLGENDSANNWNEITYEEVQALCRQEISEQ